MLNSSTIGHKEASSSFFNELKRRNVFRVGAAYAVVAWLIMQVSDVAQGNINAPASALDSGLERSNLLVAGISAQAR